MSLYDAIAEVTEEENKKLGTDVRASEREPDHVKFPDKEEDEPEDKPPAVVGTDKAADVPADKKPDSAAADKGGVKDEAKAAAGVAATPPADGAPTAADFARLRREKAELERRIAASEAKPAAAQPQTTARTAVEKAVMTEPDPNLDPEAHLKWELAQTRAQLKEVSDWKQSKDAEENRTKLREGAVKAYQKYESDFAPTVADYKEVTEHGIKTLANSIKTLNPSLEGEALTEQVRLQVLRLAAQAESRGEDPSEFLYRQSKAWGYQPKPKEQTPEEKAAAEAASKPKPPSVSKIAEHKRRSGSSLAGGGTKAQNAPSREQALSGEMSVSDWGKVTPAMLREMEASEG